MQRLPNLAGRGHSFDIAAMHAVPFADPGREYAELGKELDTALLKVARSGQLILGPVVERFEEEVAHYLGVGHAVGVASGTDALRLTLQALGVGAGDEVIVPSFTFAATAGAIVHTGATPVLADVRPETFNVTPAAVEAAVTPRTAGILAVHLYGQMAEVGALEEIATRHGLFLVEDAAQAFGASQTRLAGTVGTAGCFSFYPTKNLACLGDGGLVATDDPALADGIRTLRAQGRVPSATTGHQVVGWNSRLDALQAAVLRVKLPHVEEWNGRRRRHAAAYDTALRELRGISPPTVAEGNRHVYHQYTVRCEDRSWIRSCLEEARIGYGIYYAAPLHLEEAFACLPYREGDFPEAERASREVLSLPVFTGMTTAERERVVEVLREASEAPGSLAPRVHRG